jgi:hypothetical protein
MKACPVLSEQAGLCIKLVSSFKYDAFPHFKTVIFQEPISTIQPTDYAFLNGYSSAGY